MTAEAAPDVAGASVAPGAPTPWAWGVLYPDGARAVFVDHARAIAAAAQRHGVVVNLYLPPQEPAPCH